MKTTGFERFSRNIKIDWMFDLRHVLICFSYIYYAFEISNLSFRNYIMIKQNNKIHNDSQTICLNSRGISSHYSDTSFSRRSVDPTRIQSSNGR
jgi:hypothetical protein